MCYSHVNSACCTHIALVAHTSRWDARMSASCHTRCTYECVMSFVQESWHTGIRVQHAATHYDALQHTATHCNTLQHDGTKECVCNTLQHTATHCNTLQHDSTQEYVMWHLNVSSHPYECFIDVMCWYHTGIGERNEYVTWHVNVCSVPYEWVKSVICCCDTCTGERKEGIREYVTNTPRI